MTMPSRIAAVLHRARVAGAWDDEDVALAVLKEMREPTAAMIAPADAEIDRGFRDGGTIWRSMINAAMKEGAGE